MDTHSVISFVLNLVTFQRKNILAARETTNINGETERVLLKEPSRLR